MRWMLVGVSAGLAAVAAWCLVSVLARRVEMGVLGARVRGRLRARGAAARDDPPTEGADADVLLCPRTRVLTRFVGIIGGQRGGAHSTRGREAGAEQAREMLERAGISDMVQPHEFARCLRRLPVAGCVAGACLGLTINPPAAAIGAMAGWALGRWAPRRLLARRADARRRSCERDLAPMLDVLAMGMRAGLSFDASFGVYANHGRGLFSRECAEAYRTWTAGVVSREAALDELARRCGSRDVRRFVDMVEQSVALGSSLAPVLSDLAREMRRRRRADAEERIAKAPVKMLIPTGVLILPAMLLVVMGPVLLELAGDLG